MVGSVSNPNAIPILKRKGILNAPAFPAALLGAPNTIFNTGLVVGRCAAVDAGITNTGSITSQQVGTLVQIGGPDSGGCTRLYISTSYMASARSNAPGSGWVWNTVMGAQLNPLSAFNIDGTPCAVQAVSYDSGTGFTVTGQMWFHDLGSGFYVVWDLSAADTAPSTTTNVIFNYSSLVSVLPLVAVSVPAVPQSAITSREQYNARMRDLWFRNNGDIQWRRFSDDPVGACAYRGCAYISSALGQV